MTSGALGFASSASTLTAGNVNLAAGTTLNYVLGSSGSGSRLNAAGLTLPTGGPPITINLSGASAAVGIYPIMGYGSLSGGNSAGFASTFAVGARPASIANNPIAFFTTPSNVLDMDVLPFNATLYFDSFNRNGALSGSSPSVQNGTNNTWTAANWSTSGGLAVSASAATSSALLPFATAAGNVYTFSVTLDPQGGSGYLALGFASSNATTGSINNGTVTRAWMSEAASGAGETYVNGVGTPMTNTYNGLQTNTIVLDTRPGLNAAALTFYVGGVEVQTGTVNISNNSIASKATIANIILGTSNVSGTAQDLCLTSGPTWNVAGGGIWSTATNWAAGLRPATRRAPRPPCHRWPPFRATTPSTSSANQTLGQLTLAGGSVGNYTIAQAAAATLTLDNGGNGAVLTNYSGSNTIAVPVSFNDNVQAMVSTGSTLNIAGNITEPPPTA